MCLFYSVYSLTVTFIVLLQSYLNKASNIVWKYYFTLRLIDILWFRVKRFELIHSGLWKDFFPSSVIQNFLNLLNYDTVEILFKKEIQIYIWLHWIQDHWGYNLSLKFNVCFYLFYYKCKNGADFICVSWIVIFRSKFQS